MAFFNLCGWIICEGRPVRPTRHQPRALPWALIRLRKVRVAYDDISSNLKSQTSNLKPQISNLKPQNNFTLQVFP